MLSVNLSTPFS